MKKIILITTTIILIIISILLITFHNKEIEVNAPKFELSKETYTSSEYKEITSDELNNLLEAEESFVLFVYQPYCIASSNFNAVLDEFLKENYLIIYKISFENLQKTKYKRKIKNYPSFMIFYEGKLSNYLDAEKDEDIDYFKKTDEFTSWLESKIVLKPRNTNNLNEEISNKDKIEILKSTKITLSNIQKEKGKVNIYLFWGDGCPHCKEEKEFLSSIENSLGNLFNLHTYEVWYNAENRKIMNVFGAYNNKVVKGVPYTVIGEKDFSGFSENTKESIIKAIEEESKKNYDLYLDEISKE